MQQQFFIAGIRFLQHLVRLLNLRMPTQQWWQHSQHRNKKMALQMLQARLLRRQEDERSAEASK